MRRPSGSLSSRLTANLPKASNPVAGAIIAGDDLSLPNKRHNNVLLKKRALGTADPEERAHIARTLTGIQQARQILEKS